MRRGKAFITSPKSNNQEKIESLISVVFLGENNVHRLKSCGPIPLINVGGKTLLERQIDAVKSAFSNFEIVVCCGFESHKVVSYVKNRFSHVDIRIVENQIHYNSNCCESARLCLGNIMNDKIIICNGGVLTSAAQMMSLDFKTPSILTQRSNDGFNLEVGVVQNGGKLENLTYGIKDNYWSEIFYLNDKDNVEYFYSIISRADYKNRFLFEAINEFAKKKHVKSILIEDGEKSSVRVDNIKSIKG